MTPFRVLAAVLVAPLLALCLALVPAPARAQADSYVINLRDTEIAAFAEQVSDITGRTLILDPAVRGQVTVISNEALGPDAVWALFQSVLEVYGFAAVPAGRAWRLVPRAEAGSGSVLGADPASGQRDIVTSVLRVERLSPADAAEALRPLVSGGGDVRALEAAGAVIVTDTAESVARLGQLLDAIDVRRRGMTATIRLRFAGAEEARAAVLGALGGEDGVYADALRIAADARSNTLIVRGDAIAIEDVRQIVKRLDTPSGAAPRTRVFRLRFADSETVVRAAAGLLGLGGEEVTNPIARALPREEAGRLGDVDALGVDGSSEAFGTAGVDPAGLPPGVGASGGGIAIQAVPELNAVLVRAAPGVVAEVADLVAQLDVRRPQVLIEAAIVEISGDVAEQLGIQFGAGEAAAGVTGAFGVNATSLTGPSLGGILAILGVPVSIATASEGLSVGFGIGDEFSVLIQALAQSSRANLLSTPSLTTLDNEPAEIVVAQNVPFLTGTFSPSGASDDLFSTIEREDVGIILRVVPRVHEGDTVRLEVSQEASSIVGAVGDAVDLITNTRSIETTVLADDGATVVLGGLITDDRLSSDSRIPILGDIPVVGRLFRSNAESRTKRTLFVFLRPTILRDRASVEREAERQYRRLQDVQDRPVARRSLLIEESVRTLPLEIRGLY